MEEISIREQCFFVPHCFSNRDRNIEEIGITILLRQLFLPFLNDVIPRIMGSIDCVPETHDGFLCF